MDEERVPELERLAMRMLDGPDEDRDAAAREILARVPADAAGRLRAYRLCARGTLDRDPVPLAEAQDVLTEPRWHALLVRDRGRRECQRGRLEEGERLYEEALALIRRDGFTELEPGALLNLGTLTEARGDPVQALDYVLEARRVALRTGDPVQEAQALVRQGRVYRVLGAYVEAIESLLAGLELLAAQDLPKERASALTSLAHAYARAGLHAAAIRCASEAVDTAPPDTATAVFARNALAHARSAGKDHAGAIAAAQDAVDVARTTARPYPLAQALLTLGDAQRVAGALEDAEATYGEGRRLAAQTDFLDLNLGYELGTAHVREKQGDLQGAKSRLEPLVASAEAYGAAGFLMELHEALSRVGEALGDAAGSLAHLRRANALRDEIFSRESDVRARSLEAARELKRERERSAEELRRLSRRVMESREEERRLVAAELHDGLGQQVALLAIQADQLAAQPPEAPDAASTSFRALADRAQSIADQVDAISHRLHPAPLRHLGLTEATRDVCGELARLHDIEIVFSARGVPDHLPEAVALAAYRIVQEAIRNAVRHGEARRVRVRLDGEDAGVRLRILDEGAGFDPRAADPAGIGLASMRERALHLGGTFQLRSRPGEGTTIEATLPWEDPPDPAA